MHWLALTTGQYRRILTLHTRQGFQSYTDSYFIEALPFGQALKRIYDWDIIEEVPGLAVHVAIMNERDATRSVVADNDAAVATLMAQMEAAK